MEGDALSGTRLVAQQVEGEGVLDHLDAWIEPHGSDERPGDLRAGRVAARVRNAIAEVPSPAHGALDLAIWTARDKIPAALKAKLGVLVEKHL